MKETDERRIEEALEMLKEGVDRYDVAMELWIKYGVPARQATWWVRKAEKKLKKEVIKYQ
jgi:hypothetical protein